MTRKSFRGIFFSIFYHARPAFFVFLAIALAFSPAAPAQEYEPHPTFVKPRPARAWKDFYQPPVTPDLLVTHVTDPSPIIVTWNYDLNQYFGRLVQALAFVRGAPVSCAQSYALFAGMKREGVDFNNGAHLSEEKLLQLGRGMKSRAVLTLQLDRAADRTYGGEAIAYNVESGQLIGRWVMKDTGLRMTPESAFTLSDELARRAAAGLFVPGGDPALILTPAAPAPPEKREAARKKAAEAEERLQIPALPRLMQGYALALEAIELAPEEAAGWNALSLAALRLGLALQGEQLELWNECRQRALVAGRIAAWLAPDDARIQRFHAVTLYLYGRRAAAMDIVAAQLKATPDDPMWQTLDAIFWQRQSEWPDRLPALKSDVLLSSLVEGLAMTGEQYRDVLIEWIKETRVAPNLMLMLADRYGDFGELVQERQLHLEGSIQGSAFGLVEIARQWEANGRADEARRVAAALQQLGAMAAAEDDGSGPGGVAAPLEKALEAWCLEGSRMAAGLSQGWNPATPVFNFLQLYKTERDKLAAAALTQADKNNLRAGPHGLGWTPREAADLAGRHGVMGAAVIMMDIAKLGAPDYARPAGQRLIDLLPEDPYVLDAIRRYYYYGHHNSFMVDSYTKVIYDRYQSYVPAIRLTATFVLKDTPELQESQTKRLRQLAAYAPFDFRTLTMCFDKYEEMVKLDDMIEVAGKILERDPAQFEYAIRRMKTRAFKEGRRLTEAELQEALAKIPEGHIQAPRQRANLLLYQGKIPEAIAALEEASQKAAPTDYEFYRQLGWLYRLQGEGDKAMAVYERYLTAVPEGLVHANMLEHMTWVKIYEGDWAAADRLLRRAQDASGGKASTMELSAYYAALRGRNKDAEQWYDTLYARYPEFASDMDRGWYYLALGQLDKAAAHADAVIKNRPFGQAPRWLKVEIAFRSGDPAAPEASVKTLGDYSTDKQSIKLEAWTAYNERIGNFEWTEKMAQELLNLSMVESTPTALRYLTLVSIDTRQFDKARGYLDRYSLWVSPTDSNLIEMEARLLLAQGKNEAAWARIEPAARTGWPSSRIVGAMALLALGRNEEARQHAETAIKTRLLPPDEWRFVYAQALDKSGQKAEARKQLEQLVKDTGGLTFFGRKAKAVLGQ